MLIMSSGFSLSAIEFSLLVSFIVLIFIGLMIYIVRYNKKPSLPIDEEIEDQKSTKLRDDDVL